jgi:hypothetical protein
MNRSLCPSISRARVGLVLVGVLFAAALGASRAHATAIVRIVPAAASLDLGETGTFEIRADLSLPVLGFGLDLAFDPGRLSMVGSPVIGPGWIPLFAPDGDGLAGLGSSGPISGSDVLLATIAVQALTPGSTDLAASWTPGDLTEGFPLDPTGFDAAVFEPATVQVIPEPGTGLLVALGLAGLVRISRWPRR